MKNLLIINLFSSAEYLSDMLKEQSEINTIGVYADFDNIDPYFKPRADYFNQQIKVNGIKPEDILAQINQPIDYVLNGSEQSLALSEQLAASLTPQYENNLDTSDVRCNKYLQQLALQENSLPYIKQIQINLNNIDMTLIDNLEYPVFAKPLNGAGSIGIFLAHSKFELLEGLQGATRKIILDRIDEYLIQEYIQGDEIAIDSFSVNGKHFISNVYSYRKDLLNNTPLYRSIEIVTNPHVRQLAINFTIASLNVCQFKNGFAHTELFMLGKNDFRLIEINPRISGANGIFQMLTSFTGGLSQGQLLINLLLGKKIETKPNNTKKLFGQALFMYDEKPIDQNLYPSYKYSRVINPEPFKLIAGARITVLDVHQIVIFVSDNQKILEDDINRAINNDVI